MRKKTITKAVLLTATILALTGCNSTTSNNPTESVTSTSAVEQVTEETSSTVASVEKETTASTSSAASTTTEPTIPETTIAIETSTQVAGYDGICDEYGHVELSNDVEYFLLDEEAPLAAWKDAVSKYKWVTNSTDYFYTTMEYKGHTVMVINPIQGYGDEDLDAYSGSLDLMYVCGYDISGNPFIYDIDLNLVCPDLDWSDYPTITDQEVRDGVTWYKYHVTEGYDYWLPEHNGADWEQVYKKYVQEPYEAARNSMSEEDKVNEVLMAYEQVWNKTYYNVVTEGLNGYISVKKCYAYKNADGSITQSAGWEYCDSSIFDGTSLLEHGETGKGSSGFAWKYDGNTIIDNTEYNALASELYYHLIDLYGEECVRWNDDLMWNGESYDGKHDWNPYGDGKDACRSREEHIAKCQGN